MLQEIGINSICKELIWLKDNETYQIIPLQNIEEMLRKAIPTLY